MKFMFFSSDILLKNKISLEKNINFIYNCFVCCNHTCYCVGMVSVTSASLYAIKVDPRSTSEVLFHGIPRNWLWQFRLNLTLIRLLIWNYALTCMYSKVLGFGYCLNIRISFLMLESRDKKFCSYISHQPWCIQMSESTFYIAKNNAFISFVQYELSKSVIVA